MIKNVIFDLDGTLLDTLQDLTDSTNYTMTQFNKPTYDKEHIRRFVGNGIRMLIKRALIGGMEVPFGKNHAENAEWSGIREARNREAKNREAEPRETKNTNDKSEEYVDQVLAVFKHYYQENCMNKTEPYPEMIHLLDTLQQKGISIGIVSNKNQEALTKLCSYFFKGRTRAVIGQRTGIPKKPAPDSVFEAMQQMNATKDNTIYVGDSEVDAQTAANAGIPCVLVSWGFRDKELLCRQKSRAVIDTPMDLIQYI